MKTVRVEISGQLGGTIWMPACKATKGFRDVLNPEGYPFGERFSLRDVLDRVTNDGDFQDARILFASLKVTRTGEGGTMRVRYWMLRGQSEPEYFIPEAEQDEFLSIGDEVRGSDWREEPMSAYTDRVAKNLEGIEFVSTGISPGCPECAKDLGFKSVRALRRAYEQGGVADEPHFSWSPCGICRNKLGGNREVWHGVIGGKVNHWNDACTDCVLYLANGDEPEERS
jgi:hypothetical protein